MYRTLRYLFEAKCVPLQVCTLKRELFSYSFHIFTASINSKILNGTFYDGQLFDAYKFASDLIHPAKSSIILIDNYVDETVLMLLTKRLPHVKATSGQGGSTYFLHLHGLYFKR